ncbi:MAG: tRNA (adenosine(37)-N6)-dimethylallyltransferase MiaA [Chlorobiaceae bacterium]|nr:tRNA (adenosine(37)-N6)-dimethylallyltransferase MiaA [Chlorobiaceae bacterium]NTW74933.1 tRNA (adenosine(37)-N6)-dimethylallyltransferase MiaA [Chlorobiaceae bacterium]
MSDSPVLVILGPTASGKSELAFRVARLTGGEIVSADSRQVYRHLDIGTAKPSREMLSQVRHHFIDEREIGEPFTAGDFATVALLRIDALKSQGVPAIVAGGSTLYLEGLLKGFADLPPADPEIRARLRHELEHLGPETLYRRLAALDPDQAGCLDPTKTQRLIRSLEIIEISGMTVTSLLNASASDRNAPAFLVIGLETPRTLLYERIDRRSEAMIDAGLVAEASRLYEAYGKQIREGSINALLTVGYRELFDFFEGKFDLGTARESIARHTRNYAKRQLTFFKNRLNVEWVDSPTNETGLARLTEMLCRRLL